MTIVRIIRAMSHHTPPEPEYIMYDELKTMTFRVRERLCEDSIYAKMRGLMVAYFEAHWHPTRGYIVIDRVEDKEWR